MNLALPLQPARKILALTAIAALSAMALLGGSGIMATLRPDPITPDLRPFDLDPAQWQATWGQILEHNVDEQGRINFAMNAAERARLQQIVTFIAVANPRLFDKHAAREAYLLNAYNALAMNGIMTIGVPDRLTFPRRLGFFALRRVRIGGQTTSLYAFENDVIRKLGDPRVHFALNCMTVGCPRLATSAFGESDLDAMLDMAARDFTNNPIYVRIDNSRQTVWVSAIFKFYEADFLKKSPTLIDYINCYRKDQIPVSYNVAYLDYDWTVKAQGRQFAH